MKLTPDASTGYSIHSYDAQWININGQRLHDGSAAKHLVVTTGKRHGIASCPPTEAYAQWAVPVKHLKHGWNDLQITLQHASKPLKLVETEITLQP